ACSRLLSFVAGDGALGALAFDALLGAVAGLGFGFVDDCFCPVSNETGVTCSVATASRNCCNCAPVMALTFPSTTIGIYVTETLSSSGGGANRSSGSAWAGGIFGGGGIAGAGAEPSIGIG